MNCNKRSLHQGRPRGRHSVNRRRLDYTGGEDLEQKIELALAPLIKQKVRATIDIPDVVLVRKNTRTIDFPDFDLDTLLLPVFAAPNDDILIESLQDNEISTLREAGRFVLPDSRENVILSAMADKTTVCPFTGSPRCATS